MFNSATSRNKDANIFEIKNVPGFEGGSFKYAIDGKKLPYAFYFDQERPFFFLEADEANEITKKLATTVQLRMVKLWKAGKIQR